MSYYVYSSESLPNPDMMGHPGYTPDNEYIRWHGIHLGTILKNKWTQLPDYFTSYRRPSWRSPKEEYEVPIRVFKPMIENTAFADRGVIILDHEPTVEEKAQLESKSKALNLAWRMRVVEEYENAVKDREVTGIGRSKPTPYEDECYEILGLTKPYSVEAKRAQRHPGEAVGEQIVAALERLENRRRSQHEPPEPPATQKLGPPPAPPQPTKPVHTATK